jgi:outer membrane protein insertion porin family
MNIQFSSRIQSTIFLLITILCFCFVISILAEESEILTESQPGNDTNSVSGEKSEGKKAPENQQQYIIRQVKFEGNQLLNQKQLSSLIGIKPGENFQKDTLESGLLRILDEYRQRGIFFAQIQPRFEYAPGDSSLVQIIITVQIQEGKPLKIGTIALEGNTLFTDSELKNELRLRTGDIFNDTAFNDGIERILQLYSERGHPKVNISPVDFDIDEKSGVVNLKIVIDEGPLVKINEVKLEGLQKTKERVVLRELFVHPGDIYVQEKIDRSYHRLNNLGYFYEVSHALIQEGAKPDEVIFNAQVIEARTGRFNGVLGYAPPTSLGEKPQLTGVIEATETNLLGTGRGLNVLWKSGTLEVYKFGYEEPWVFGKPLKIGFEFSGLKQTEQSPLNPPFNKGGKGGFVSKERSGSLIIGTNLMKWLEGSLAINYKRIDLPAGMFLLGNSQSGVKYGLTFSLQHDSRDYYLNPTRGRVDKIAFEVSQGDFKLKKIWIDFNQYFQTWAKQVIAIGLHAASAWGQNIPPTELFYLGGANTLRGYNEDWFRGPRRLYSNIEYRFLTGRASQIFLFLDLGAVSKIDQPNTFESLKIGYGFGMRLESRGGLMSLDYGLARGYSALEGKIHLSLGTSF